MLYVFVPYYNEDTPEFKKSLESQTVKYILIKRDRKKSNILWTKAVNDFYRECKRWQGTKDDDVICIMNNDIEFDGLTFNDIASIRKGDVYITEGVWVEWRDKKFEIITGLALEYYKSTSFIGHCFAMTLGDFKKSGGFCKLLPHALSDIDYGIGILKKLTPKMGFIVHKEHPYEPISKWSLRAYNNPILWTIFLLRHPNRYTFINILKAWYDGLFR